ncbi:MAG: permease prefix domain 1-containing protein [Leucobacter sp.]
MNVIIAYLETMFSAYPQTPRLLEAKTELQTMMEDAYATYIAEGVSENEAVGRVITEFGNLDEVAPALGITQEIRPVSPTQTDRGAAPTPTYPQVTLEEAKQYAEARRTSAPRLATAIALCIVSPILLVSLAPLGASGEFGFNDQTGSLIGLVTLLILVTIGVLLFVRTGQELAPFKHIQDGKFTRSLNVERWAQALATEHAGHRSVRLQIAIALWILSAVPVLAMAMLPSFTALPSNTWSGVGVAITLVMVAIGILVYVPSNWAAGTAEALTQEGRPAPESGEVDGEQQNLVGVVASIYWPLLTAIFLGWSFIGNAWDISWIVWPIGAVLFGAIAGGLGALESYRGSRRGR